MWNDNKIKILGKVSDPSGMNTFLINKTVVELSSTGVFEYTLDLQKGENQVQLLSINSLGKLTEKRLIIDCKAVKAGKAPAPVYQSPDVTADGGATAY